MSKKIDLIIPAYKPGEELILLMNKLKTQTLKPDDIYIINTIPDGVDVGSYFDAPEFEGVHIKNIMQSEFDHAATRGKALADSFGDTVVFMTQDAVPAGDNLLENLVNSLWMDEKIACAYARQLPRENATVEEKIGRLFNYPEESITKTEADLDKLGIKTFFCSDVCAAYKREIFEKLGGFVPKSIFNEDMLFAAKAIRAGYAVRYEASAIVIHSHFYSAWKQFKRNFDNGASQAMYSEIIGGVKSESEGKKLVKTTINELIAEKKALRIPAFIFNCGMRYLGFKLGTRYKKMPMWMVRAFTDNNIFWK